MIKKLCYTKNISLIGKQQEKYHDVAVYTGVTDEDIRKIEAARKAVYAVAHDIMRQDMLMRSYLDFVASTDINTINGQRENIEYKLQNYITSRKIFLNHWESHISELGNSKLDGEYDRLTHWAFDNCDSYVIAEVLRNRVEHKTNIIDSLHCDGTAIKVTIKKSTLLADKKVTGAKKQAISRQPDEIDLLKVAKESMESTMTVHNGLITVLLKDKELVNCCGVLMSYYEKIRTDALECKDWNIIDFHDNGTQMSLKGIDWDAIKGIARSAYEVQCLCKQEN